MYVSQRHGPEGNTSHKKEPETIRGDNPNDQREINEQTETNHSAQAEDTRRSTNQLKGKGKGRLPTPAQSTTNVHQQVDLDEAIVMVHEG